MPYLHYFINPSKQQQEQQNLGLGSYYPHETGKDPRNKAISLNLHNLEVAESIFKSFAGAVPLASSYSQLKGTQ